MTILFFHPILNAKRRKELEMDITDQIIKGKRLSAKDDLSFLLTTDTHLLSRDADRLRRHFCKNQIDLCTIINGRKGNCSEDCKFCVQSVYHSTTEEAYPFLPKDIFLRDLREVHLSGIHHYAIVTSGKKLTKTDLFHAVSVYQALKKAYPIPLCGSHGLLSQDELKTLQNAGMTRYHMNLETSKNFFPHICTTHTYDEKLKVIQDAQTLGLSVCSGGIIGMGESWQDRIDLALALAELNIQSIPINVLIPIRNTAFSKLPSLTKNDILRTFVIFRFLNPTAYIRIAAGRAQWNDHGKFLFQSGANAAITGDMLTTHGTNIQKDVNLIRQLGFHL